MKEAWQAEGAQRRLDELLRDSETQCSGSLWQPLAACRAREVIDIEIEIEIELGEGREACGNHANQGEGDGDTPVLGSLPCPRSQLLFIHNLWRGVALSSCPAQRLQDRPSGGSARPPHSSRLPGCTYHAPGTMQIMWIKGRYHHLCLLRYFFFLLSFERQSNTHREIFSINWLAPQMAETSRVGPG